jgi:hypothetical protein
VLDFNLDMQWLTSEISPPTFDLPPLDLELLNMALDNDPILEPTVAEVAAYLFLRGLNGNQ